MSPARRFRGAGPFLAAALLAGFGGLEPADGQELTGVALGPDDDPLPHVPVVLHSVGDGGGAFVATDTTDGDGAFRFTLQPGTGIYFAALRFREGLYIGPAVEAGGEPVSGYVLRVDPANEAGAVAAALAGRGPAPTAARRAAPTGPGAAAGSDAGAFLLVALLGLAAAAIFLYAAPRYRTHRTRDGLIELAEVENALERSHGDQDRASLESTRDRLRKQLAPGG